MRISGDGTAAGGPYRQHGSAADHSIRQPVQPAVVAADGVAEAGDIGYRGPTACAAAGITYRQLDYWARTGLVEPSVRPAYGSGTQRLYSFRDVVLLKIVKRFLDTGVALQNIRTTVQHLRARGFTDLERMTLMSDGATVYECSSPDEVVSLLQGGQGVFGIAVGVVWRDVDAALSQLHGERVDTGETLIGHNPADELARRRNRAG
ncbi:MULTISPECIES: MerR family transcriptional regulator [unclassified Streptomyces]|uniref:MerR family transcriptional regulator n=1 Tax=unclassified Streptomyces TaxID=2593676 RepID=UPI002E370BD3|nr:MerR family transcriptional regulator [Streptomyces sp. NBC_01460]WSS30574.1 MerR family transcriptional regulator [Streptomyces sp. NBC_01185]